MRSGSVTFWAWIASIAVHTIVLIAFGIWQFSQTGSEEQRGYTPIAQISQVKRLMQASAVMPKPKIEWPVRERFTSRRQQVLPSRQVFETPGQTSGDLPKLSNTSILAANPSLGAGGILQPKTEFFGSWTAERKICFVVDCSGSMRGILGRVRNELKESIKALQADQYFYIIFFGNNRLMEFGDGRLIRATKKTKSAACDFVDMARPSGRTNAWEALERSMRIRDNRGAGPAVVYFLTDGFELTTQDMKSFSERIADLLSTFAPATRINTIGFWPQTNDRKMLEVIANQSGAECVFITDSDD